METCKRTVVYVVKILKVVCVLEVLEPLRRKHTQFLEVWTKEFEKNSMRIFVFLKFVKGFVLIF